LAEIAQLGARFYDFCDRFRPAMRTQTHDTSAYGVEYVSGLLRLPTQRTIVNISRQTGVAPQNMQQFISDSPWPAGRVIKQVQAEVKVDPTFAEAVLVVDESAEAKAGEVSVGAGRQYNGRLGKVDLCQVGVFVSLVTPQAHLWLDGELFLPEAWFDEAHAALRHRVGLPEERTFQTKPQLTWQMIQRVRGRGIRFVAVTMDDLYGRNVELCQRLEEAHIEYYGDIPANTVVYLDCPRLETVYTKRGKPAKRKRVVAQERYEVRQLLDHPALDWQSMTLRPTERGYLRADWARCRVWLLDGERRYQRWLLIRREANRVSYTLSNAPVNTSLHSMAWRHCHRVFIERDNQDSKSELGWDECQTLKYRAWEHQLALTILASWFVAQVRLDWQARFAHDPALLTQYQADLLPLLSVSNVRTLLRAALPLPQLTPEQATTLVIQHLLNRTRSRQSRRRKARDPAA
jgi:SRSO17 transposase